MRTICFYSRLLSSLFLLISSLPLLAADTWQISRSIQSAELQQSPQVLSISIYLQEDAAQPVQVQHFESGQWQTEVDLTTWPLPGDQLIPIHARLSEMDAFDTATLLWAELEVDGQPVGGRFDSER